MDSRKCEICLDSKPVSAFNKMSFCDHHMHYCSECWKKHLTAEIQFKGKIDLKCLTCKKNVEEPDLKKIVDKAEYERYDLLRFNNYLKTLPDFRWCSRTNCGTGQEVDGGGSNSFFTCAKCSTKTCFHHKVVWHTGLTCRDYDYWIIQHEDNATSNYIAMNTKQCPKCQSVVEKDGGCDHMTCKPPGGCSFEFCWLCLANFGPIRQDGNHRHNPSCQYYAAYDG